MPQSKGRRKAKTVRRPTPPKSTSRRKSDKESSTLYKAVMFGLMAAGVLLVVTRYMFDLNPWLLMGGLGAMAVGFLMTTNYH